MSSQSSRAAGNQSVKDDSRGKSVSPAILVCVTSLTDILAGCSSGPGLVSEGGRLSLDPKQPCRSITNVIRNGAGSTVSWRVAFCVHHEVLILPCHEVIAIE